MLEVTVEVPRGGFVKRRDDGSIDYVSPVPCPFNYGSVAGTISGDGDRLDAVVLGPRLRAGSVVTRKVLACVMVLDAGEEDPKFICGERPMTDIERGLVLGFFRSYGVLKGLLNLVRGRRGQTRFVSFHVVENV